MARRYIVLALVLGITGAGAGCGDGGGRAAPANRAERPTVLTPALEREQQRLHRQVLAALHHRSGRRYDPRLAAALAAADRGRTLTATERRPARTTQGAHVRLRLPAGRATALAIGPDVPLRLAGSGRHTAPATFTLTFTHLHGAVPLRHSLFGIVDESGALHVPPVRVSRHGETAKVVLRATLATGDGRLTYAPAGRPVVTWDYTLETD